MRVSRIYLNQPLASEALLTLPAGAARYVARVLRLKPGAPLVLFNGDGRELDARVETVAGGEVRVRTGASRVVDRESPLVVHLGLGLTRGKRMDFALQKAVELGVSSIAPLATGHSVVHLDEARAQRREAHWQGVVADACEQCGRSRLPGVEPLASLPEWLHRRREAALKLVLAPQAGASLTSLSRPPGPVALLVGPEGGLAADELEQARRAGFHLVALGPRTLRTETAALAALAALQLLWGDLAPHGVGPP